MSEDNCSEELKRFKKLFDFAPDMMGVSTLKEGRYLEINKAFTDVLGYKKSEVLGKTSKDIGLFGDNYAQRKKIALEIRSKGYVRNLELVIVSKSGKKLDVLFSAEMLDKHLLLASVKDITEHKKAEAELLLSEQKYRDLTEHSTQAIANHELVLDNKGKPVDYIFLDVNKAFEELTGLKREKILGKSVKKIIPKITESNLITIYGKVVLTGKPAHLETYFGPFNKHYSIIAYKTDCKSFAVVFEDITLRKSIEKELHENEERYKELLENSISAIVIYAPINKGKDFLIRYINKSAEKLEKVKRADIIGKRVTKIFPGVRKFGLFKILQNVNRTGKPLHHPLSWYSDGRIKGWRENYVYKIPNGEIVAVYQDLSKQKFDEEKLRETERQFKDLSDNALDMIQSVDRNGKFVYVNAAWMKKLGYSEEESRKMHFTDILKKECIPHCQKMFEQLRRGIPVFNQEVTFISKTGREMHVQGNITAKFSKNRFIETRGIFRDVTDRKIADEELKKSENMARESERMLQNIIDILPIRIFWKDLNLKYLGCNAIFAKDAGKSSFKELIGKNDFDMTWKEQAKIYRADDLRVIESGIPKLNYIEPQTTPKGDKIWLITNKVPLKENNKIIGILGTYGDITEQKKIEEDLLKKKDELEKFNTFAVDRELKMIELKKEVNELLEKAGQSPKYNLKDTT